MRNTRLTTHANGANKFAGITGLVMDPIETAQAMAKLFGTRSIRETEFGAEIDSGRGFIRLATDESIGKAHQDAKTHPANERPIWHILSIGVKDLGETEKYLKQAEIPHQNTGSALQIDRDMARGLILEFIE